jgi:uncharacterized Tic20 family protein
LQILFRTVSRLAVPPHKLHDAAMEPTPREESLNWPMLCHLSALAALILPAGGHLLGPLVVWLIRKNNSPRVDAEGKESLNFQLSITLYSALLGVLGVATLIILVGFLFLALATLVYVAGLVLAVYAAIETSNGRTYRYPFCLRLLK